jgi:hypothetical protein
MNEPKCPKCEFYWSRGEECADCGSREGFTSEDVTKGLERMKKEAIKK